MSDDLDELTKAEQRGYANAMEAERKLHEDRIEQLERERERLALAICGGEDAPGYANAQTVEDLEKVARDNAAWGMWQVDQTVQAQAKLAKAVEALREWDALIQHQYTGSRDAMSDMTYIAQHTADLLAELEGKE